MLKRKLYISGDLAFRLWRAARAQGRSFAVQTRAAYEPQFPRLEDRVLLANWLASYGVGAPYTFMVSSQSDRRKSECGFTCNMCRTVSDKNSFYRVVDQAVASMPFDLYIVSPELSFVQMSAVFTAVQEIGYGFELCGTYTPEECSKEEPERLPLLSNAQRLITYADSARGLHGLEQARSAARYVLDNSASVKETEIAMMFIFPRCKDGFAVKRPKLNYCIPCDPKDGTFVSYDEYVFDMFWIGTGVGMEVQSEKHHGILADGGFKWIKDARRRNTLQFFGNTIIEATPGDYSSALGLSGLAQQVCELAGFRSVPGQFDVDLPQLALYDEIFALSNYP